MSWGLMNSAAVILAVEYVQLSWWLVTFKPWSMSQILHTQEKKEIYDTQHCNYTIVYMHIYCTQYRHIQYSTHDYSMPASPTSSRTCALWPGEVDRGGTSAAVPGAVPG